MSSKTEKIQPPKNSETNIPKMSKAETLALADIWANESKVKDQEFRGPKMLEFIEGIKKEFLELNLDFAKYQDFLAQNISESDPNRNQKIELQKKMNQSIEMTQNRDSELQTSLKSFMDQIGGFPSMDLGIDTVHAAFLVAQHAGENLEFQKKCLKMMLKASDLGKEKIPLIYFMYLADRIISKSGFQVFGTQNNTPIAALHDEIMEIILDTKKEQENPNPAYFITKIIDKKPPLEFIHPAKNSDVCQLLELADKEKKIIDSQQGMIPILLLKYGKIEQNI